MGMKEDRIPVYDGLSCILTFEKHVLNCPECKGENSTGGSFGFPILRVDKPCPEGQRLYDLVNLHAPGPIISFDEIKKRRFGLK
jgi:hypothetical protein